MRRNYSTEQFGSFLQNLKESFWGEMQGKVKRTVKELLEADSEQQIEEYLGLKWYERADSRNGTTNEITSRPGESFVLA